MTKYATETAQAAATLLEKGSAVTFARTTSETFTASTGALTGTSAAATGYGVLTNYRSYERGDTIQNGDRKLIYSGEEPLNNDTWDGYRVISVMPVNPDNDTAIIYIVQLRK